MSDLSPLQFERPEFEAQASNAVSCARCHQRVVQSYYEVNGAVVCSMCRDALERGDDDARGMRVMRAAAAGFGAALLGALLWWGVRKATGYEIGIVSIAIGVGVGRAVRWGSRGRGGWAYQLLAVLLTYTAIAGNYVPDVIMEIKTRADREEAAAKVEQAKTPTVTASAASQSITLREFVIGLGAIFLVAAIAPFAAGVQNFIGILIILFGLYEAWKINRNIALAINGPYSVTPA